MELLHEMGPTPPRQPSRSSSSKHAASLSRASFAAVNGVERTAVSEYTRNSVEDEEKPPFQTLLTLRATINRSDRVYAVDVSREGTKLLVASRDRFIALYELDIDGEEHGIAAQTDEHDGGVGVKGEGAESERTHHRQLRSYSKSPVR